MIGFCGAICTEPSTFLYSTGVFKHSMILSAEYFALTAKNKFSRKVALYLEIESLVYVAMYLPLLFLINSERKACTLSLFPFNASSKASRFASSLPISPIALLTALSIAFAAIALFEKSLSSLKYPIASS